MPSNARIEGGTIEFIRPVAGEDFNATFARVRHKQWQAALARVRLMRTELIRLGCTDETILGPEVVSIDARVLPPPEVTEPGPLGRVHFHF